MDDPAIALASSRGRNPGGDIAVGICEKDPIKVSGERFCNIGNHDQLSNNFYVLLVWIHIIPGWI